MKLKKSTQLAERELIFEEYEKNKNLTNSNFFSYNSANLAGHYLVATVAPSVELTAGLLMLVAGILSSLLTCRLLFCAPRTTTSGGPNSLNFSLGDETGVELPQEATGGDEKETGHVGKYRRF